MTRLRGTITPVRRRGSGDICIFNCRQTISRFVANGVVTLTTVAKLRWTEGGSSADAPYYRRCGARQERAWRHGATDCTRIYDASLCARETYVFRRRVYAQWSSSFFWREFNECGQWITFVVTGQWHRSRCTRDVAGMYPSARDVCVQNESSVVCIDARIAAYFIITCASNATMICHFLQDLI